MNTEPRNIKNNIKEQHAVTSVAPGVKENENELQLNDETISNSVSDAKTTPTKDNNSSKIRTKLGAFLQHPLTLLLIGAILSSYLIPSWTRQWQNQQTELNTKVEIINSIDKSSTQMIMAVQYAVLGTKSQSQLDYDSAFRQWQIDKQIIRSKLQAYFPGSQLVNDCNKFSEQLDEFYRISGSSNPIERKNYWDNWLALRDDLYNQKDELNRKILDAKIYVFSK